MKELEKKLETKECSKIRTCVIYSPAYRGCKDKYLLPVDGRKRKVYCPMFVKIGDNQK